VTKIPINQEKEEVTADKNIVVVHVVVEEDVLNMITQITRDYTRIEENQENLEMKNMATEITSFMKMINLTQLLIVVAEAVAVVVVDAEVSLPCAVDIIKIVKTIVIMIKITITKSHIIDARKEMPSKMKTNRKQENSRKMNLMIMNAEKREVITIVAVRIEEVVALTLMIEEII